MSTCPECHGHRRGVTALVGTGSGLISLVKKADSMRVTAFQPSAKENNERYICHSVGGDTALQRDALSSLVL
jgi:hypothetical protein